MTDVSSIISQLEQQKASIDRAITALREITPSPAPATRKAREGTEAKPAVSGSPLKGRALTEQQKQAISRAWTPERKRKFAEFHVKRMARARGEDPAKALRDYRRRKQKEQAVTASTAKASEKVATKAPPRKAAVKKTVAKTADAASS